MKKNKKMRTLIKRAQMGNPYALYTLGRLYEEGKCVEADIHFAKDLIALSAEKGYAPAVEWMQDYMFDDDACVQSEA